MFRYVTTLLGGALFAGMLNIGCNTIVDQPSAYRDLDSLPVASELAKTHHIIHVSIDGLRPDAIRTLGPDLAPAFHRFIREGSTTDNARTDVDFTVTLPNHVSQLTGRPVHGPGGHGWTTNSIPGEGETLHSKRGDYVASVFDVAHDAGLTSIFFAGKPKFSLFEASYAVAGNDRAPSIDRYHYDGNSAALIEEFTWELVHTQPGYAFLHIGDADRTGHKYGWDLSANSRYLSTLRAIDTLLGQIFDAVEQNDALRFGTTIILTSDHGGSEFGHGRSDVFDHYTIPFYVWGAGVSPGTDLYELNPVALRDPGTGQPVLAETRQPIRNGAAANLALRLLGLSSVPGSTINVDAAPLVVSRDSHDPIRTDHGTTRHAGI